MNESSQLSIPTPQEIDAEIMNEIIRLSGAPVAKPVSPVTDRIAEARGGIVPVAPLLALDGEAFVVRIYRDVLGREPDPHGLEHHLGALRDGRSKLDLITGLHSNPEGVRFGATLVGVAPRSRLHRLYALPLIGRPLRLLASLLRVASLIRDVQGLHDVILSIQHLQAIHQDGIVSMQRIVGDLQTENREIRPRFADLPTRAQVGVFANRIADLAHRIDAVKGSLDESLQASAARADDELWAEPLLQVADRQDDLAEQLQRLEQALQDKVLLDTAIARMAQAFQPVAEGQGWPETGAALVARAAEALRLQEGRIRNAEALAEAARNDMLDQQRRLGLLLETIRRQPALALDAGQAATIRDEQDHLLDPLYVAFEARFRGSREMIMERQRVHVPVMLEAGAGTSDYPIIDVGAGRGEWLELLGEHGLTARGIDLNTAMVAACKERGLDCTYGDAAAQLALLDANSVGAVTGFHIIEHLPFRVMVALFDEALRVLVPGGVVLFETPNPANLQVGSRWFYLDPTHNNPLPSEMVAMIAEARGFNRVLVKPLHPMTQSFDALDKRLGEQLDALLHGPQDYALIAYKA